jgi:hypothetical protein
MGLSVKERLKHLLPGWLVELMPTMHADPLACVERITGGLGYEARILVDRRLADARAVLENPPFTWHL